MPEESDSLSSLIHISLHKRGLPWSVCLFDSLHPCKQFFSYVRTDLPGLNQY